MPKHLPGCLNVLADSASRQKSSIGERSLDERTFGHLWERFGPFGVDLFANRYNNQIPIFISPFPDPLAADENALSLDWNQWERIYAFPPRAILPDVVQRLHHYQGKGVLIAPYHPCASWFTSLLMRCPLHSPLPRSLDLSQTIKMGTVHHQDPQSFCLHAWRL